MKRVLNSVYNNEEDPLQKQFKTLEMEWDSIKQSIPRSNRRNTTDNRLLFQLYNNCPKELMSLLQNENPPNSGHHDRAAIEIIEQREADFDNGRLKGRRLFEEIDVDSDDEGGIDGDCFDMGERSEVSTEFSCKGFESYGENCNQFCVGSPEKGVTVVAVKRCGGGGSGGGRGCVGRLMISVVVMFALAIVAFKCSGEGEQMLVPT